MENNFNINKINNIYTEGDREILGRFAEQYIIQHLFSQKLGWHLRSFQRDNYVEALSKSGLWIEVYEYAINNNDDVLGGLAEWDLI